jgi:hypothetical protein
LFFVFDRPAFCETSVFVTSAGALASLMISGRSSDNSGKACEHRHETGSQVEKPEAEFEPRAISSISR